MWSTTAFDKTGPKLVGYFSVAQVKESGIFVYASKLPALFDKTSASPSAMRAPANNRPAFSPNQVFDDPADVIFSGFRFLHGHGPANPFIASQSRRIMSWLYLRR